MDNRVKESIGKLLAKVKEKQDIVRLLGEVVSRDAAEHITNIKIRKGKIVVFIDSPVWAQELNLQAKQVLEKLRNQENTIEEIKFLVGR